MVIQVLIVAVLPISRTSSKYYCKYKEQLLDIGNPTGFSGGCGGSSSSISTITSTTT